jgi:hypothetical protein
MCVSEKVNRCTNTESEKKMEEAGSFETSVTSYITKSSGSPEDKLNVPQPAIKHRKAHGVKTSGSHITMIIIR